MIELVAFLVGFVLGCLAADVALKKKTGYGIEHWLQQAKPIPKAEGTVELFPKL